MAKGATVWFTGLPSSGKSTIAHKVEKLLREKGHRVEVFDGDVIRKNLCSELGFSKEDRDTNIKRIAFVCKLMTRNDVVAIAAAISPYRETRDYARKEIGKDFLEVYVRCPLSVCKDRDVKGLYKKALSGELKGFTGIDDPYEEPLNPELILHTDKESVEESVQRVMAELEKRRYL
ncbi:MAG: adenylyl-sulfate kinase [Planctomycetes bacterium GWA2_50_13]|nr:MAG: adenylyl-sulfate kinase [Planctomycetes bacterium GWA2_50_13]OHB91977.1 MAG: adenylyl-sulfate kinase [Planctomycetes bacterium RIFCSPHIGHO2_12_FULL_51_37]OHB94931.1 MAG: adenylyl-sulfate kinase [Planctomycetes bacterium RIFCSPLOWO2_02_FULL_50_16]OHC04221.1 MAG: adenylyl-sulfate kinase [Planctomycetes bacterium RIFCSPLOWO2_12_FULL_50_35]HCN20493.1 adenylyl-sulfate kinase [Planctomycetia bacterium]